MVNYIVLAEHPWGIQLFGELTKYKGNWHLASSTSELTNMVDILKPRYIFVTFWHEKVPKEITDNYECVGFHPSALPVGRGGSPIQHYILDGVTSTPLFTFRLNDEIDGGDLYSIYLSANLRLYGSAEEIYLREARILRELIGLIVKTEPRAFPQSGDPTYLKRRTPEESKIPKLDTLEKLHDFIRMLDAEDYPKAFIEYEGFRFDFTRAVLRTGRIVADVEIVQSKV